jgi:hypothetical protein
VGFDRDSVYTTAKTIRFAGKQYRSDIGIEAEVAAGGWPTRSGRFVVPPPHDDAALPRATARRGAA